MPFRDTNRSLQDIAEAVSLIEQFDTTAFKVKFGGEVERKLLVISEAAIRLGGEAEARCPGLAWRDIRGIGNWLRHQYESIELPVVWKTVRDDLPPLKAAVLRALNAPPANPKGPTPG